MKIMMEDLCKFPEFNVQYLEICDPDTLLPLEIIENKALIAVAAFLGQVRLIDNVLVDLSENNGDNRSV